MLFASQRVARKCELLTCPRGENITAAGLEKVCSASVGNIVHLAIDVVAVEESCFGQEIVIRWRAPRRWAPGSASAWPGKQDPRPKDRSRPQRHCRRSQRRSGDPRHREECQLRFYSSRGVWRLHLARRFPIDEE